jgi:hypothetical protein
MKTLAQYWLLILLFVIVLAISAAIYGKINRAKKDQQIRKINDILDRGVGVDGRDIKSITLDTKPDLKYNAAVDAKAIYDAKKWYSDDEEAVYTAFSGKTKAQIAQIYQTFLLTYKVDLDDYLKSFLSLSSEYPNVIRIVNQAA